MSNLVIKRGISCQAASHHKYQYKHITSVQHQIYFSEILFVVSLVCSKYMFTMTRVGMSPQLKTDE